jgi:prepilin-type N-terminal cleavage/methylation domain-containing protein
MDRQRGYTILEVTVAVAIFALLLGSLAAVGQSRKAFAAAQSAREFDALLAQARALASSSGNGATLVFAPDSASGTGALVTLYSGRPNRPGAVPILAAPPQSLAGAVTEATAGSPPFSVFVDGAGALTVRRAYPAFAGGAPQFTDLSAQPACPPGGLAFSFTAAGSTIARLLSC